MRDPVCVETTYDDPFQLAYARRTVYTDRTVPYLDSRDAYRMQMASWIGGGLASVASFIAWRSRVSRRSWVA